MKRGWAPTSATATAIALALTASLAGCDVADQLTGSAAPAGTSESAPTTISSNTTVAATFVRVVDGDTIIVRPTTELPATDQYGGHSVRLLGIDAPEMHKMSDEEPDCGAKAATDHLKQLLAGKSAITLVFDPESDHTDRYGRSLAYVEVDGHDLNLEQAASGLAEAWYPYGEPAPTRFDSYESAQRDAESTRTGSWDTCGSLGR